MDVECDESDDYVDVSDWEHRPKGNSRQYIYIYREREVFG